MPTIIGKRVHTAKYNYGWTIVGLAFCSLAFWFGIRTSFSVFYVAFCTEFPWQPSTIAGAQSVALISAMVSAPLFGALIDHFGYRKVILTGIVITAVGLGLSATVSSIFDLYVYYGIITGSSVMSVSIVTYSIVISKWFREKRGFASGIAVSGMGLGMLVFVPLVQHCISTCGWQGAFWGLSLICGFFLFPATFFLLRERNEYDSIRISDSQVGRNEDKSIFIEESSHISDLSLSKTVTMKAFWYFLSFAFFASIGVYIILVHNVKCLVDRGMDAMVAAALFAMVGAISSAFRIIWGFISDRIGREMAYSIGSISACIGIAFLLLYNIFGLIVFVIIYVILFSIGWGVTAPSIMSSSADIFDGKQYGFIFGIVQSVINLAAAIGSFMGGYLYEKFQSYSAAFSMSIITLILSCLFIWKAAPRKISSIENNM